MPFPAVAILDTFNRADGAVGSPWAANPDGNVSGQFNVASNLMKSAVTTGWMTYDLTVGANMAFVFDLPVLPGVGKIVEVDFCLSNVGTSSLTGYSIDMKPDGSYRLFTITNNTFAQIHSFSDTLTAGDSIGVTRVGSIINVYRRTAGVGTLIGTKTDATFLQGGKTNVYLDDATVRFDNFGVASLMGDAGGAVEVMNRRRRRIG